MSVWITSEELTGYKIRATLQKRIFRKEPIPVYLLIESRLVHGIDDPSYGNGGGMPFTEKRERVIGSYMDKSIAEEQLQIMIMNNLEEPK